MSANPLHLTDRDFRLLADGNVSAATFDRLCIHLNECAACADRCDRMETIAADTLAHRLRLAHAEDDAIVGEAGCQTLDQWLQNGLAAECRRHAALAAPHPVEIGAYRLDGVIGCGGMGVVHRATHIWLNRVVALKLPRIEKGIDPTTVQQFTREFEAIGRLDHPNIVRPLDAGCQAGQTYLAMELVDGLDLARVCRQLKTLRVADVAEIGWHAAAGLQHAHDHSVIHRDIKPSNLMLARVTATDAGSETVSVRIMDLGLVQIESTVHSLQQPSERAVGTPGFHAPEQSNVGRSVDARADVFGLGATLLNLVANRLPNDLDEWRSDASYTIPAAFIDLVSRMLATDPAARPGSMSEIMDELNPLRGGSDLAACLTRAEAGVHGTEDGLLSWSVLTDRRIAATRSLSVAATPEITGRQRRSRPRILLLAGVVVLLGAITTGIMLNRGRTGGTQPETAGPADEISEATIDVAGPDQPTRPPVLSNSFDRDLSRRVALAVFELNGRIDVSLGEREFHFESADKLPTDPFDVTWIMLEYCRANDDTVRLISDLPKLAGIILSYTDVTDEGVRLLGNIPTLESVFLY